MSATIKDVAKEAGVSVSTVSRVLREEGYFSETAKRKVLKASKKINYRVNIIGKSLRSNSSMVLGHISKGGGKHFFGGELMKGIDEKAYEKGYHVILSHTSENGIREREQIDTLLERRVEGIIVANPVQRENIEYLKKQNTPFVMVENTVEIDGIDKVIVDNRKASYGAVSYLFEKGHKNIAFVGRNPLCGVSKSRLSGYKMAYIDSGLEFNEDLILLKNEYTFESGKMLIEEFFAKDRPKVTAIIVTTDIMLLGVMQALYYHNIKVPEDISLIGLNDLLTPYLTPPVTSIVQPVNDMGKAAVDLLVKRINEPAMSPTIVTLETNLFERETVKDIS